MQWCSTVAMGTNRTRIRQLFVAFEVIDVVRIRNGTKRFLVTPSRYYMRNDVIAVGDWCTIII